MTWLNYGCPLFYSKSKEFPKILEKQVDFAKLSENERINLYKKCHEIFVKIFEKLDVKIDEECRDYSNLFESCALEFAKTDLKFYSLCFELLPICFFKENSQTNFRAPLIRACRLIDLPDSIFSKLLCYLAFKNDKVDNFSQRYIEEGGTESCKKLLLQIHQAKNIDWWAQELFRFQTNIHASDFDIQMIDHIFGEKIECDNFFLTMVITLFYHCLEINQESIANYSRENIQGNVSNPQDTFIYNILVSSSFYHQSNLMKGFLSNVYKSTENSLFAVHFLGLIKKKVGDLENIANEFSLAVYRYVELLSSYKSLEYRTLIPSYLYAIDVNQPNLVLSQLQNVVPAFIEGIPLETINKISDLTNFEDEYCLKSIEKINEIQQRIQNHDELVYDQQFLKSTSEFLNDNFLQSDIKIQREMVNTLVNCESEDPNEHRNFLPNLEDLDGSVVVGMIESYLDVDHKDKEKICLEQRLFDCIASTGDMPEFDA